VKKQKGYKMESKLSRVELFDLAEAIITMRDKKIKN